MVDMKKAFKELKKPLLWFHYALGTAGLFLIYKYILKQPFVEGTFLALVIFYITYILVDRTVHGVLEL